MEKQRTKCEVWSRCMGYHRPVSQYNTGKKSEFYSRKYFEEGKSLSSFAQANQEFNEQYLTK